MSRVAEPGSRPTKTGGSKGSGGTKVTVPAPTPAAPTWQDYLPLIQNDPIYRQAEADSSAADTSDAAQLGSGILGALVNRGVVPDIAAAGAALGLSPEIINWIKSNVNLGQAQNLASQANTAGTSLEAQLNQAHKTNVGNITDSLAARGMLSSGATPFLSGQEATRDTTARYNADKALADYISGAYSSFAKNEQGRAGDLRSALTDAYTRVLQSLGGAAPPHAGSSTQKYGTPPTVPQKPVDLLPSAMHPGAPHMGGMTHIGPAIAGLL